MRGILASVLVAAIAALAVGASPAAAATSVSIGTPDLIARVAISVPVTVSCTSAAPPRVVFAQSVSVTVRQAAGTEIARGSGSLFANLPAPLLFPCDGSPHTVNVTVFADPAGPPFHGGPAVVTAFAGVTAGQSCGFPGCFFDLVSESASTGPVTVKLH